MGAKKPKKITVRHEGLGRDHVVPNNPKMLAVIAKSGWKPVAEAGDSKPAAKTAAGSDKT